MATPYQVTFFLEGVQSARYASSAAVGWTETFYGAKDISIDGVRTDPDVENYLTFRRRCLAERFRIAWVRVTNLSNIRLVKVFGLTSAYGNIKETPEQSAQVQCAVLADLVKLPVAGINTDITHHRRFLLRGLPGNVIDGDVIDTAGVNWKDILAFFDLIAKREAGKAKPLGGFFEWLGNRYTNTDNPKFSIPTISADASAHGVLVKAPPGMALPLIKSKLLISGSLESKFNRTWTMMEVTDPDLKWHLGKRKKAMPEVSLALPDAGTIRLISYLYGPFDQYTVIGLRSKRTGRLFRQLRGRSPNRA